MSQKFQLKNGLEVLLTENNKAPVVAVQMWVRTGSADERKKEEGISHFIEHLLFKGTKSYKPGEIASVVEGSGGELNAYTSFDQTVFHITISKHYLDTALNVIKEMMGCPLFDRTEIDNEREVVIEEIRQGRDSLSRVSSQKMFSLAYKKHPYGIPVIGFEKVVKDVSQKTILKYYSERYSSRNMFLMVAGDFTSKELKPKIAQLFGDMPSGKVRKVHRSKEAVQTKSRIQIETSTFGQSVLSFTWKAPNVKHKDVPALDILTSILSHGESSRLVSKMRVEKPMVNGVSAYSYTPMDSGLLTISINYQAEMISEIVQTILEELEKICTEFSPKEEMQKALTILASDQIYSYETVDGLARNIASSEFYFKDPKFYAVYFKKLYQTKPVDVLKAARKYLNPKTLSISGLTKDDLEKTQSLAAEFVKKWDQIYKLACKKSPKAPKSASKFVKLSPPKISSKNSQEVEKIVLKNGTTILFKKESDIPTLTVRAAMLGGLRAEPNNKGAVTEMLSRCLLGGTKNYSEHQINMISDSMASGVQGFSGRNSCGVNMTCLSAYRKELLNIFGEALISPVFPESVTEREKVILLNQIKTQNDKPASICGKQFMKGLFVDHPYAKDMLGEDKQAKALKSSDLLNYHKSLLTGSNLVICAVGDISRNELVDSLTLITKDLPRGQKFQKNFPANPKINEPKKLFTKLDKEQTHIMVGYPGLKIIDSDRFGLHIINAILSGQGGRLFIELRDKNSLAYSVYPTHMEGVDSGYFAGYISCAPDKSAKAIDMLLAEFQKLAEVEVSSEELERAKKYIIGGHDIEMQRKGAICNSLLFDELYGLDYRESLDIKSKYEALTSKDLIRISKKIFSQPPILSVVGSDRPW